VNQRESDPHRQLQDRAPRSAARGPDIVLVGEMRDLETVAIAIETARRHLVSAPSTLDRAVHVDRIIDQFPPDRQAQIA